MQLVLFTQMLVDLDVRELGETVKDPIWLDDGGKKIVPFGEGLVDFRSACRVLKEAGYDGTLTLHSEYDGKVDEVIETTRRDRKRFRAWLDEARDERRSV